MNVEKYLKYIPLALFGLTMGKLLVFPATWEGATVALVAGLLAGAYEFKNHDKKFKEIEAKLEIVTNVVNNHAKAIEDTKSSMSTIKIAQQLSSQKVASNPVQRVF